MKHLSKAILRTAIIGTLVIILFVGVILVYYNMVYDEKKDGIIKDGRILANQSADEFDRYLSTNIDLIKITAYTLDGMITEKKSNDEIQDYLVGQSTAIRNAVVENYTGLYGYINGRFFSGTYWIPPEGYDSRIRPWYTKPMENPGKITILEPYVDVQSGNTMMALGKTLCDGVSVISVDVSLDQMQYLTEEAVVNGGSDIEMIIAGDGSVVTHSDIDEVGKNYFTESGTLGSEIFKMLSESRDSYFEVDFEGENYIVYNASFQDDWYCISVHRASEVFNSLTRILIATIVIAIAIVVTIGIIIAVSGRRSVIAERALASSEAKSAFLSNMSHEIRTPINAVLGMNEMILRESREANIREYSENVKMAGQNLLGIVNDILDFSKIEAGKMEIIPAEYRLSAMLVDLVNMIKPRFDAKGLVLDTVFDKNAPEILFGDENRIKQVIANLLTNAVKYTEEGSVKFSMSFEKSMDENDGVILNFSVADTGIGIKEEDLGKLFSEFERIEEKRNRNIEGTGLGLNITKHLLEMMGSSLEVKSDYGKGSVFSFTLKQKVTSWEPMGDYDEAIEKEKGRFTSYKIGFMAPKAEILAVDDNPMNLTVLLSLLKQTKVNIDTAERGEEGLNKTLEKKYDLIFLDHMMPEKDGIETLHELRSNKNNPNIDTPAICLTANAIAGAKNKYIAEGFDDYLTKPVDYSKLEEMMLKYLPKDKIEEYVPDENETEMPDGLPENLESLDRQGILDIYSGINNSGTIEAYIPLIKIFCKSIDEKSEEIEKLYKDGDIKNFTIKVHALKSSARIIGATEFGEEAQKLENAGTDGDIAYINSNCDEFLEKYKRFKAPLSQFIEKEEESVRTEQNGDKPEADEALLKDAYAELYAAADDMDCDILKNIFKDMEAYRIPDKDKELWQKLINASEKYDYETVMNLLNSRHG